MNYSFISLISSRKSGKVTPMPPLVKTDAPNVIPPVEPTPVPKEIPNEVPAIGGGGVAWQPVGSNGIAVGVDPGGGVVGIGGAGGPLVGEAIGGGVAAAAVAPAPAGAAEGGARAAAIAGTMFGLLVLTSSLMWAMYKFKPGLMGGAGGGGGGGGGPMSISSPRATTNYALVKSQTGSLGTGYRGGGGSAGNTLAMTAVKVEAANGTATGVALASTKASAGTQTPQMMAASMFADYPSIAASGAYASMGAISGLTMAGDGQVTRATQTDLAYIAGAGGTSAASASESMSSSHVHTESHLQTFTEYQNAALSSGATSVKSVANTETQTMPEPSAETPLLQQENEAAIIPIKAAGAHSPGYASDQIDAMAFSNMMASSSYAYNDSKSYSSVTESSVNSRQNQLLSPEPTLDQSSKYSMQMQNMSLNYTNGGVTNLWAGSSSQTQAGGISQGVMMASEEIRVDCVLLTNDGRHVVTGSIFGPPQVWDLRVCLGSYTLYSVCY